jgi:hypothetical protein
MDTEKGSSLHPFAFPQTSSLRLSHLNPFICVHLWFEKELPNLLYRVLLPYSDDNLCLPTQRMGSTQSLLVALGFGRLKSCLSSRLRQSEGLPCTEQAALAPLVKIHLQTFSPHNVCASRQRHVKMLYYHANCRPSFLNLHTLWEHADHVCL